jgi:hypothetical protein
MPQTSSDGFDALDNNIAKDAVDGLGRMVFAVGEGGTGGGCIVELVARWTRR